MAMSRKDYQAIAEAIAATKSNHAWLDSYLYEAIEGAFQELEERLVDYFVADNPRFLATKFYGACADVEVSNV